MAQQSVSVLQRENAELKTGQGVGPTVMASEYEKIVALVEKLTTKPKEMQELMRKHGLKIDNLDDMMQKLAFTFYTELCALSWEAEHLLEARKEMGA